MLNPPNKLSSFIWSFVRDQPIALSIILITACLWAAELSISPYLFKLIIDGVSQQADHPEKLLAIVLIPAILYASMSVFLNISFRIFDYTNMKFMVKLYSDMTKVMFDYTMQHSFSFFQNHFAGSIANKILYLPRDIESIVTLICQNFIPKSVAVLIAAAMLMLVKPIFSAILLVWVILFVSITCWISIKSTYKSKDFAKKVNELDGKVIDSISNIITGKIFANLGFESQRILDIHDEVNDKYEIMKMHNLKLHMIQGIGVTFLISAMLFALIYCRLHELVTVGDFVFVLTLSSSIILNVWSMGQDLINFTRNAGKCQEALSLISLPHEITDTDDAKELVVSRGEIAFNHVDFSYRDKKVVFNDLNITIQPGQKVGLVGFSGGGKSTFVNTILRLFDINSGTITIDGQDIKHVFVDSLRKNIAYIPQEPELFHRSVFDNICYGRLDASYDEVIKASKKAHCHEFIQELPEGYDALVGERGVKLSGGQRQRIAIARAILKQASILILDEATSALDSVTEKFIQESLHEMMQGKTTIVIAHRLSTLLEMDRILVFKDGAIIEDGSLEALKNSGGQFSTLWNMQGGGYLPEV